MRVNFTNKTNIDTTKFEIIIKRIFKRKRKEMNIIFVDSEEIKIINNKYRKINKITDVISFASIDGELLIETKELGDIFICIDKAEKQAKEYGHSLEREIGFLAVHGFLHLKGYDHQTEECEKEMFKMQEKILKRAKLRRD